MKDADGGTRRMLTPAGRVEMSTGRKAGWTLTQIAGGIEWATSVVSREVARDLTKTQRLPGPEISLGVRCR